jgi:hypothetical protein
LRVKRLGEPILKANFLKEQPWQRYEPIHHVETCLLAQCRLKKEKTMTVRKPRRQFSVVIIAILCLLFMSDNPTWANLFVSDHSPPQVRKFDDSGAPIPPVPYVNLVSGGLGEGIDCLILNGQPILFVADTGGNIQEYNPDTGAHIKTFATGLLPIGAISLSKDGSTLYVAAQSFSFPATSGIYSFDTASGAQKNFVKTDAAHDVRVAPNGDVYAADPFNPNGQFPLPSGTGVQKFSANLTTSSIFIPSSAISNPSGMTFDQAGDLWVSNFTGIANTTGVFEYDPSGTFMRQVTSPLFSGPVGLDTGPDGNIYVADIRNNDILMIDLNACTPANSAIPSNCSVNQFISSPDAGPQPKYLEFTENCCVVPEPGSLTLLGFGIAVFHLFRFRSSDRQSAAAQKPSGRCR